MEIVVCRLYKGYWLVIRGLLGMAGGNALCPFKIGATVCIQSTTELS